MAEENKLTWQEKIQKVGDTTSKFGNEMIKSGSKGTPGVQTHSFNTSFNNAPQETIKFSDERLKNLFGEDCSIVDDYANIDAYLYNYTDYAKDLLGDEVDDKTHVGVMAQDLANNETTADTVVEDDTGYLKVDAAQLTMNNTAAISELARRVKELENIIKGRN